MPSISDVLKSITDLAKKIAGLPGLIVAAMKKSAGAIVATVAPMQKAIASLPQPFSQSAALLQYLAKRSAAVQGAGDQLRAQLTTFVAGLNNCAAQTNTLAGGIDPKLPRVAAGSAFTTDLIANVLSRIPDIALLPVAKALNDRPGWEKQPDTATLIIVALIPKTGSKSPQDQKEVDVWFVEVLTILKMINTLIGLITRLLPRDLNAGIAVVGEGGTLTFTGHPVSWAFVLGGTLIDEAQTVLSGAQQLIKLNR